MKSGIFKINLASVADALLTAVVFAVLSAFLTLVTTAGFDLFTANWGFIGHNMANLGFIAGVVSLGQDFLSTNSGSVLGITPDTTTPPAI